MEITTLISIFFAAMLGAIFTSAGFLYKRNDQRNKELRGALFELLRLYHTLEVALEFTPKKYLEAVDRVFLKIGIEGLSKNEIEEQAMLSLIEPQISDQLEQISGWDSNRYQKIISKISSYEPLLAYTLSVNSGLDKIIDQSKDALAKYKEVFIDNTINRSEVEKDFPKIEEVLINEFIDELRNDLVRVAGKVGIVEKIRIRKWCRKRSMNSIDESLESLFKKMVLNINT